MSCQWQQFDQTVHSSLFSSGSYMCRSCRYTLYPTHSFSLLCCPTFFADHHHQQVTGECGE